MPGPRCCPAGRPRGSASAARSGSRPPSSSRIAAHARAPSSAAGTAAVVSGGEVKRANGMSSKPAIDRSSGTRMPRSPAALSSPIATRSLNPSTAVAPVSSTASRARAPASKSTPPRQFGDGRVAVGGARVLEGREPRRVRGAPGRPAQVGEAAVAEAVQMLDDLAECRAVVGGHGRGALMRRPIDEHDGRDLVEQGLGADPPACAVRTG